MRIWWHWHAARTVSSQKIYGLYGLKHQRGGVTDAGETNNEQTNSEDRATQPMEAGGWVSQWDCPTIHNPTKMLRNRSLGPPWIWLRPSKKLDWIGKMKDPNKLSVFWNPEIQKLRKIWTVMSTNTWYLSFSQDFGRKDYTEKLVN